MKRKTKEALETMKIIPVSSVRAQLRRLYGRMHVGTDPLEVARETIHAFGGLEVWEALDQARQEQLARAAGYEWRAVVNEYVSVMRSRPDPTERDIRQAMMTYRRVS